MDKFEPLNKKELKNLDELKKAGRVLRAESEGSKDDLRGLLKSKAANREKSRASFWEVLSANSRVMTPIMSVAGMLLVAVIVIPQLQPVQYYDDYPYTAVINPVLETDSESGLAAGMQETGFRTMMEDVISIPSGMITLPDYPIDNSLNKQARDYQEDNGSQLERKLRIDLMLKDKDALKNVRETYENFGGHIDNIRMYSSTAMHISGNVPADRADDLRFELQEMAGNDRFVIQTETANDKIPELINIDDKMDDLEEKLRELEIELAATKNNVEIIKLKSKIEGVRHQIERLNERKDVVEDKVDYVSFQIEVTQIPHWYGSSDKYEVNQAIAGYEEPTFGQRVLINIALVIVYAVLLLSYTFWLVIPFIGWRLATRKRRKLMKSLE